MWKGAPLALLLCPSNQGYLLDIVGVGLVLASRVRDAGTVHSAQDYVKEAELRLLGDAATCYVLACTGSPLLTRIVVLAAYLTLLGVAYAQRTNTKLDHWDEQYQNAPAHAPLSFRNV